MNKTIMMILMAAAIFGAAIFLLKTPKTQLSAPQSDFEAWKMKYHKRYGTPSEDSYRLAIFTDNQNTIKTTNAAKKTYTLAENQFMDLTTQEFASLHLGYIHQDDERKEATIDAPQDATVDWRTKGAVTPVKDQGQCGSCWAFSTTGSLEGASALFGSGLQSFSEQQLVDCSGWYGNMGCNGGLMDRAFNYVKAKGITTEDKYPYKAVKGSCQSKTGDFKISKHTDVPKGNCDQLEKAITQQPTSVGVDAEKWQFYSGGIFSDCGTQMDHGVLAVGYADDYWLVKNSWNTSWGEDGYIRLKKGNTCGICNSASYPTI